MHARIVPHYDEDAFTSYDRWTITNVMRCYDRFIAGNLYIICYINVFVSFVIFSNTKYAIKRLFVIRGR